MRIVRVSLSLVSLWMFATLASTLAMSRDWQVQTAAGQKVAAHFYCAGTNQKTCAETGLPQIEVTAPPSSGAVSFGNILSSGNKVFNRVGEVRVGKSCPSVMLHCIEIYYTPAPDYSGSDHFSYTVAYPGSQKWHDTLTVVVTKPSQDNSTSSKQQ